jgi:hypothetical protein
MGASCQSRRSWGAESAGVDSPTSTAADDAAPAAPAAPVVASIASGRSRDRWEDKQNDMIDRVKSRQNF